MRWIVVLVALAGCTEVSGPAFSSEAEHVVYLAGSDPCHEGVCWLGAKYHPALQDAGVELVLGMDAPPRRVGLSGDVYFWMRGSPPDIHAFDAGSRWLYRVWDHADGLAYDLRVHNGTASFVTSPTGTPARPDGPTTLRTWNASHRGAVVEMPLAGPVSLLAVGDPGWVVSPWMPDDVLHQPEAYLLHRSGWVDRMIAQPGGPATVEAAFGGDVVHVAVNQWTDQQYSVTSFTPSGGVRSGVRSDASAGAVGLVAAPGLLAFAEASSPGGAGALWEVRLAEGVEVHLGAGRPVGYVGDTLIAQHPVDGGTVVERSSGNGPIPVLDVLPGVSTQAVGVDGTRLVVRVAGPFDALAVLELEAP